MPSLAGRVAVVTGAGRNIGRAIALHLAAKGATVVANDVVPETAHDTVAAITAAGGAALAAPGDLAVPAEVDAVFTAAERNFGTVRILVNNAYWPGPPSVSGSLLLMDEADWQSFVDVNMSLFFLSVRRAARAMAAAGVGGSVVNISSHGAIRAHRNRIAYDAVKGAMDAFTRAVALDLAPWGIRVNTVRPGAIAVDRGPDAPPDPRAAGADQIPLGRMGTPADIAAAVAFLASDQADYITGQGITVDGGIGAQARPPGQDPRWSPDLSAIRAELIASGTSHLAPDHPGDNQPGQPGQPGQPENAGDKGGEPRL